MATSQIGILYGVPEGEVEGGNGTAAVSRKFMALFPGLFRLGEGRSFCY